MVALVVMAKDGVIDISLSGVERKCGGIRRASGDEDVRDERNVRLLLIHSFH